MFAKEYTKWIKGEKREEHTTLERIPRMCNEDSPLGEDL